MIKTLTIYRFIGGGLLMAASLSGCNTYVAPIPAPKPVAAGVFIGAVGGALLGATTSIGAPIGALLGSGIGGALGDYLDKQSSLLKQVQDSGVLLYRVGSSVTLVLSADQFFQTNSPALNEYAYPTLNKIVRLLRPMQKVMIRVAGYTDNRGGSPDRNQALSQQWADNIARYLWEHGVDTRILYTVGMGDCASVASNATSSGRASNRRIEITFQEV